MHAFSPTLNSPSLYLIINKDLDGDLDLEND